MDENPEESDKDIDDLINSALSLTSEDLQSFKSERELREKLKSIVAEYLDSFYIFGYDIEGKTILVKGAKTDMQMDALDTLAMRLFVAGNLGGTYGDNGTKYR
jgi:hypothetical protein